MKKFLSFILVLGFLAAGLYAFRVTPVEKTTTDSSAPAGTETQETPVIGIGSGFVVDTAVAAPAGATQEMSKSVMAQPSKSPASLKNKFRIPGQSVAVGGASQAKDSRWFNGECNNNVNSHNTAIVEFPTEPKTDEEKALYNAFNASEFRNLPRCDQFSSASFSIGSCRNESNKTCRGEFKKNNVQYKRYVRCCDGFSCASTERLADMGNGTKKCVAK